MTSHNILPDTLCFNLMIRTYSDAGDVQSMLKFFDLLEKHIVVPPDSYTFHYIINAFKRLNDQENVKKWSAKRDRVIRASESSRPNPTAVQ